MISNYPNPFNPATMINFSLANDGHVSLQIYNNRGRLVRTLISGSYSPGCHSVTWDASDDAGNRVTSGIYFAIFKSGERQVIHKLMLMK